jgi:hypothetical protein
MQKLNREPSRFRDKSRALLVTSSAEKIEWQKVTTLSPSPTCMVGSPRIRQKRWTTGGRWAGRPAAGRRRPWVVVEVGGVIVSGLPGFEAVV